MILSNSTSLSLSFADGGCSSAASSLRGRRWQGLMRGFVGTRGCGSQRCSRCAKSRGCPSEVASLVTTAEGLYRPFTAMYVTTSIYSADIPWHNTRRAARIFLLPLLWGRQGTDPYHGLAVLKWTRHSTINPVKHHHVICIPSP